MFLFYVSSYQFPTPYIFTASISSLTFSFILFSSWIRACSLHFLLSNPRKKDRIYALLHFLFSVSQSILTVSISSLMFFLLLHTVFCLSPSILASSISSSNNKPSTPLSVLRFLFYCCMISTSSLTSFSFIVFFFFSPDHPCPSQPPFPPHDWIEYQCLCIPEDLCVRLARYPVCQSESIIVLCRHVLRAHVFESRRRANYHVTLVPFLVSRVRFSWSIKRSGETTLSSLCRSAVYVHAFESRGERSHVTLVSFLVVPRVRFST